jgi:hypothetical protein
VKIEHGTYTEAHKAVGGEFYKVIPAIAEVTVDDVVTIAGVSENGETFSKIYTNGVSGQVLFTLSDDSTITLAVFPGTMIPLVTKKSSVSDIVVFR